jgi:predicted TIM-barrel fold metal-dependent hydrolase
MFPLITLGEHFLSEVVAKSPAAAKLGMENFPSARKDKLMSLSGERLQDMKDSNISLQIVSHHAAVCYETDICQKANDEIYQGCQNYKSSFAGFADLPMADPVAANDELTRCIKELGFVGGVRFRRCINRKTCRRSFL